MPAGEETISAKHLDDLSSGERRRLAVRAVLRTIATVVLVLAIYFLIPMDRPIDAKSATGLVLGVLALFAVIVWQVRQIIRSEHPSIRAVEALAFTVPLYILLYATTYYLMARAQSAAFGGTLTRIDAMYFSSTIFTTVGFGDVAAKSQAARVVVTSQLWLDVVILGLVARVVVNAVKLGRQRHADQSEQPPNVP